MINDNIPDNEMIRFVEMFEKAVDHVFKDCPKQPSLFSHKRQEFSGLDINTYIYIADHYDELKERLNGRKRNYKSR